MPSVSTGKGEWTIYNLEFDPVEIIKSHEFSRFHGCRLRQEVARRLAMYYDSEVSAQQEKLRKYKNLLETYEKLQKDFSHGEPYSPGREFCNKFEKEIVDLKERIAKAEKE
jgi:hypothetical protein